MADNISFALLDSKHLNKPPLHLKQIEVAIAVSGPTDPLSLQMMRDAVEPLVKKNRDLIVRFVEGTIAKIGKLMDGDEVSPNEVKSVNALIKILNEGLERIAATFEKDADKALTQFCEDNKDDTDKLEEFAKQYKGGHIVWKVETALSAVSAVSGAVAIAQGDYSGWAQLGKGAVDIGRDLWSLGGKMKAGWEGAGGAAKRLKTHLESLKNARAMTRAQATQAKELLDEMAEHLAKVEPLTRKAAVQLGATVEAVDAVKEMMKSGNAPPYANHERAIRIENMEKNTDELIKVIAKNGAVIQKFRPVYREAKKKIDALVDGGYAQPTAIQAAKEIALKMVPVVDGTYAVCKYDLVGTVQGVVTAMVKIWQPA
jgi:hypothetical protein